MIRAILYTTNAGTTAEYAAMLGEKTSLPVYSLADSNLVPDQSEVIYLGWVMASSVKGYKKASKRFKICAVCGVCMGATGSQIEEVRKNNAIPDSVPVFTLQGGFNIKKLHGIYRLMMTCMVKTVGKGLAAKKDRTPEEDDMLDMMMNGKSHVSVDNLKNVLGWYETNKA